VLKDIVADDNRPVTAEAILKIVAEFFGIKCQEMKSKKRTKEIALPRQIAMYLCKQCTDSSLNDIGKNFGGKDHATVIYACRQIEERRAKDADFSRKIESLINKIKT